MTDDRKPRGDARLKTLPKAKQEELYECLATGTIEKARAWLKADGIRVGHTALSEFYSWYGLQLSLAQADSTAGQMVQFLKDCPDIGMQAEQADRASQAFFEMLAVQRKDSKEFARVKLARQRDKKLELEERKLQRDTCQLFLRWYQDQKATAIANSTAGNAEKIEQLGQLMFGEDWS